MRLKPLTRQTFKSASVAVPLLACMHMAHGEGPAATAAGPEWLLLASPFVWAPSMSGQVALGGAACQQLGGHVFEGALFVLS